MCSSLYLLENNIPSSISLYLLINSLLLLHFFARNLLYSLFWPGSKVVMPWTANPLSAGSIPALASTLIYKGSYYAIFGTIS